ncbi:MAG: 23S rRNA (guanosine(2251)-2'-O)-methyltransferase RlmB [Holosporales bacterium]|jgi:23S rRNA (guanosine2251-2'-O)-methyltransferase|nr:23S rRNA (guanosine(2251)-2'-O)-methyltransferase RlmB [Holosporales bacterium]
MAQFHTVVHSGMPSKELHWFYGTHTVLAALKNPKRQIVRIVSLIPIEKSPHKDLLLLHKAIFEVRDKAWFARIFGATAVHQGLCLQVAPLEGLDFEDLLKRGNISPVLVLDQLTDPQNIGALLRSAVAFGVQAVLVPAHGGPELTSALCKCACGALEYISIVSVPNLAQALERLKKAGYWCVGLDEQGTSLLSEIPTVEKVILIVGSEGTGMRRLTRERCDFLVKLPTVAHFSTLNAAQSATVALYELFRQEHRND